MIDHKTLQSLKITEADLDREADAIIGQVDLDKELSAGQDVQVDDDGLDSSNNRIITGQVIAVSPREVMVSIGGKADGQVDVEEFDTAVQVGDEVGVIVDYRDDHTGILILSKKKADRILGWERIITNYKEGDAINGVVSRKIRGGLLVDVGVPVFLPASQVSVRRMGDIGEIVGQEIACKIIKIDERRRNIVVSRRKLIEEERESQKQSLLKELQVGDICRGVVKNIADFGAFVDIGGIDGLLHITDMSWGRVSHPSEMLKIDQEIEVKVLKIDFEKERIALGLKQRTASPWEDISARFPVGSNHQGQVVNATNYGAFIQLEEGVEGLVHISQMSWGRRVNHPLDVVQVGTPVEVVILAIDEEKQEISLGMKQMGENPWDGVENNYEPGRRLKGTVRNLTNYGAFIELEDGVDGLLHVSDLSWTKKITHPSDVLEKGSEIDVIVLQVDREKKRIALGVKQLEDNPWDGGIQQRFPVGSELAVTISKVTAFGAFAMIEDELEGLIHLSELSKEDVDKVEDVVNEGDQVQTHVLRIDPEEQRIALSLRDDWEARAHFTMDEVKPAETISPLERIEADFPDEEPGHEAS